MKYSAVTYAKAFTQVFAGAQSSDEKRLVTNFFAVVERNGDASHLSLIVKEVARMMAKNGDMRSLVFESARPLTAIQKKELSHFIKPGDQVEERINPELVAGVRVVVNDEEQFDGSMKGKLDKMFENI